MGSPDFGIPSLAYLYQRSDIKLIGIMTQPDKKKGRGKILSPTPIKQWSIDHGIPVSCPTTKEDLVIQLNQWNPTLIIVIAYGMILPKIVTDSYHCINAHASLLPKYRGASPIQAVLLHNEKETGITLIKMNDKMDEGDIVFSQSMLIKQTDNFKTIHDQLSRLSVDALDHYLNNPQNGFPQNHQKASYCQKLTTKDRQLNPTDTIEEKYAKIRAFSPQPGAFFVQNTQSIKILDAHFKNNQLIPIQVQPEGKKQMTYDDYLRGGYPKLCLENE